MQKCSSNHVASQISLQSWQPNMIFAKRKPTKLAWLWLDHSTWWSKMEPTKYAWLWLDDPTSWSKIEPTKHRLYRLIPKYHPPTSSFVGLHTKLHYSWDYFLSLDYLGCRPKSVLFPISMRCFGGFGHPWHTYFNSSNQVGTAYSEWLQLYWPTSVSTTHNWLRMAVLEQIFWMWKRVESAPWHPPSEGTPV